MHLPHELAELEEPKPKPLRISATTQRLRLPLLLAVRSGNRTCSAPPALFDGGGAGRPCACLPSRGGIARRLAAVGALPRCVAVRLGPALCSPIAPGLAATPAADQVPLLGPGSC